LYVVGDLKNEEELRPFAHILTNLEQAIPRLIVYYTVMDFWDLAEANNLERFGEEPASTDGGMRRMTPYQSSSFQALTPKECHFGMAESQIFEMSENKQTEVRM
jgi:hypothetical protein